MRYLATLTKHDGGVNQFIVAIEGDWHLGEISVGNVLNQDWATCELAFKAAPGERSAAFLRGEGWALVPIDAIPPLLSPADFRPPSR